MDFGKALEAMKTGKKVRRTSWNHTGYLVIGSKEQYSKNMFIRTSIELNQAYSGVHPIDTEEILAENWEVIEDIPVTTVCKEEKCMNGQKLK